MNLSMMLLPLLLASLSTDAIPGIKIMAGLNMPTMSNQGGEVFLQLSVLVPQLSSHGRRPMNLSVVLDRSGSMADQGKLEFAKNAICTLVDQLREEDIFSVVIYDDVIEVLRPAGRIGDHESIKNLVRGIFPRNSTNLSGGMLEGFHQVEQHIRRELVNRVVLISDGLANVGITNNNELARIARGYMNKGITLTTMGVGLDYNENLMVALSEGGGGNYYFIESPHGLASIMRREFDLLSSVFAHKASIEIRLGSGVSIKDVIGHEWQKGDGSCSVLLGDLYGGDVRDITIQLEVPPGTGSMQIAEGTVQHDSENAGRVRLENFSAQVRYSANVAAIDKDRDLQAQSKADVAVSTRAVELAVKAMDEGKMREAESIIGAAKQSLQNSPAAPSAGASGAVIRDQASRLEEYKSMISNETDRRKVKKEIQFRNYQTQKAK